MGVVYRAHDETLARDVALKVVAGELVRDEKYRVRLLREARAAAAVVDPAMATVYEVGEIEGTVFIAMELVSGQTLREVIEQGPMEISEALRVAIAVAGALAKAHAVGVVHRDVKPENVALGDDGSVKVLDFGIARRQPFHADPSTSDTPLTLEGAVMGTPGYMAPEQNLGMAVDHRSDIFSLGVTLYELLTTTRPFSGGTALELSTSVVRDDPTPLRTRCPQAWPALEKTLARCLEKDPRDRFESAEELRQRLQAHAAEWREGGARTVLSLVPPAPRAAIPRVRVGWVVAFAGAALLGATAWLVYAVRRASSALPAVSATVSGAAPTPSAIAITDLPPPATKSPEALDAYRRALSAFRDSAWTTAQTELERALQLDPTFAAAHMRLGLVHGSYYRNTERAREQLRAAAAGRATLGERDALLLDALEAQMLRTPSDWPEYQRMLAVGARRWPNDAELAFLAGLGAQAYGEFAVSQAQTRRAVELDPRYADAWQVLGQSLASVGRREEAVRAIDRCIELSEATVDCLNDRFCLRSMAGDCRGALQDAQTMAARAAFHPAYRLKATALAATGAKEAVVREALEQAARHNSGSDRDWWGAWDRIRLAVLFGRFDDAETEARLMTRDDHLLPRREATALAVELRRESGRLAQAAAIAATFLDNEPALAPELDDIRSDPTMLFVRLLLDAGQLDRSAYEERRRAWIESWGPGRHVNAVWWRGYVVPARDAAEARDALGRMPAGFDISTLYKMTGLVAADVGRAHLLAGSVDKAIALLRTATADCSALLVPFEHTRSHFDLGRALEARGATAEACAAYRVVVNRWGASASVTASSARARIAALECPSPR